MKIKIKDMPKGYVPNAGSICGKCRFTYPTFASLMKHWEKCG